MKATTVLATAMLAVGAYADFEAPRLTVDLNAEPEDRWGHVLQDALDRHGFEYTFQPALDWIHGIIPDPVFKILDELLSDLESVFPKEYAREIDGIHNFFVNAGYGDKMDMGEMVGLNMVYELSCFCTSTAAQADDADFGIAHGRNLDYGIPGMRNITYTIDFAKDGEIQYHGSVFATYVGLLTGMSARDEPWSVSIDQREHTSPLTPEEMVESMLRSLISALEGGQFIGMFLRDSLANVDGYDNAVKTLSDTRLVSESYLIVAGDSAGEGAVITRNRDGADESAGEGVWSIDYPDNWYRLETNYDHWEPAPSDDADRRAVGNAAMQAMGSANLTTDALYDVMSTAPVLNDDTQMTAIMVPHQDFYRTVIREP